MSKDFTEFCQQHHIHPEKRTLESLQQIAQVCQEVISQDCVYPTTPFSDQSFDDYLAFLHTYTDVFLPQAKSKQDSIPALGGLSVLQYAAMHGYDRVIRRLEPISPDQINARNQYGMSPLHLAATQSHLATCRVLCELGANVHLENNEKQLPLYCVLTDPTRQGAASIARQTEVFRELRQHAPETIQHRDRLDQNPTHLMAMYGHLDLLEEAMAYDPNLVLSTNTQGIAPIHAAINHQQLLVLQTIAATVPDAMSLPGHNLRLPLHYAVLADDPAMVDFCCQMNHKDEIINARDKDTKTAWMMASEHDNQDILDILARYNVERTMGCGR